MDISTLPPPAVAIQLVEKELKHSKKFHFEQLYSIKKVLGKGSYGKVW